jgi:alpha-mannosidase
MWWDSHPDDREELRRLLRAGRVELVGGAYNEPDTNLSGAELTARSVVYGFGYQRDVLGGEPVTAWQLDPFGHEPSSRG